MKAYVLATGPSLDGCSFETLSTLNTIGVNLSFVKVPSKIHCVVDLRAPAARQTTFTEKEKDLNLFILQQLKTADRVYCLSNAGLKNQVVLSCLGSDGFSFDLKEGAYTGTSSTFLAWQVAVALGFNPIYFLGLDQCVVDGRHHCSPIVGDDVTEARMAGQIRLFNKYSQAVLDHGVESFHCSPYNHQLSMPFIPFEETLK